MVSKRLSREAGHRRKFLAIIDETPECRRAVFYASRRAKNTSGTLVLLYVIDSSEFQHFLGVGDIMRAEAEERAHLTLAQISADVRNNQGIEAEMIVREGQKADAISKLIDDDQDIAVLVLAAGGSNEGPGPLVQSIAARGSAFPIPVTIVPDSLSDEDIDAVA
ncbi:universal stress protein [Bartonella sp. LJL80]